MRSYGARAAAAALLAGTMGAAANGPEHDEATIGYGVYEYHDWAGIYAGIQGGWLLQDEQDALELESDTGKLHEGPFPYDSTGSVIAGGLLGINMQVGHWVYGGELDVEYTDVSGRFNFRDEFDELNGNFLTKEMSLMGSLRARVGFALDRLLVYGTGGVAAGRINMKAVDGPPPLEAIEGEETEFGWTAGGGLEVEVWNNFSAGVEYRYTDLGRSDHSGVIFNGDFTYAHTNRFHAVRARLVYRMHI